VRESDLELSAGDDEEECVEDTVAVPGDVLREESGEPDSPALEAGGRAGRQGHPPDAAGPRRALGRSSSGLKRTAHFPSAAGARTSLFAPTSNRFYLAVPRRGGQASEIRIYEARE